MDSDEDSVGVVLPPSLKKERRINKAKMTSSGRRRNTEPHSMAYGSDPRSRGGAAHNNNNNNFNSNATFASTIASDHNDDFLMNTIPSHRRNNSSSLNSSQNRRKSTGDYYDPNVGQNLYDDGIRVHASRNEHYPSRQQNIYDDGIRVHPSASFANRENRKRSTGDYYDPHTPRHNDYYDDGIRVAPSEKSDPLVKPQHRTSLGDKERRRMSTGGYYDHGPRHNEYDSVNRVPSPDPFNPRPNRRSNKTEYFNHDRKSIYDDEIQANSSRSPSSNNNNNNAHNSFDDKQTRRRSNESYYNAGNSSNLHDGIRVRPSEQANSSQNDRAKPFKEDGKYDNHKTKEKGNHQRRDSKDKLRKEKKNQDKGKKTRRGTNGSGHSYESLKSQSKDYDGRSLTETVGEINLNRNDDHYPKKNKSRSTDSQAPSRNKDTKTKDKKKNRSKSKDKKYSEKISRRNSNESKAVESKKGFGLFKSTPHSSVESLHDLETQINDADYESNTQIDGTESKKGNSKPRPDTKASSSGSVLPYFSKKKGVDKKKKTTGGSSIIHFWDRKKKKKIVDENSSDEFDKSEDETAISKLKKVIEIEGEEEESQIDNEDERKKRKNLLRQKKDSHLPSRTHSRNNDDASAITAQTRDPQKLAGKELYEGFSDRKQRASERTKSPVNNQKIKPSHPVGLYEPWVHRRDSNLLRQTDQNIKELLVENEPTGITFRENANYTPEISNTSKTGRYGFVNQTSTEPKPGSPGKLFSEMKCEEAALYPTFVMASMEMDAMTHRHLVQLARINRRKKEVTKKDDLTLATHRFFPKDCLQILRLLAGNDRCVDCGRGGKTTYIRRTRKNNNPMDASEVEDEKKNDVPIWASLTYGTLLCDQCAFRHITKSEEVS